MDSDTLPSGFHRAEAAWLEPPDEQEDIHSLVEYLFEIRAEVLDLLYSFEDGFCGTNPEELNPGVVYEAAKRLVSDLEDCLEEWDRVEEHIRVESYPDRDDWGG